MAISDRLQRLRKRIVQPRIDWRKVPVFVTTRDLVTPAQELVAWLEDEGVAEIILVDNASTFPTMTEWLDTVTHRVVRLPSNIGHLSAWSSGAIGEIAGRRPYVVTDPDILPDEGAHGAMARFAYLLNRHPDYIKVGFGLRIDDLPEELPSTPRVLSHEVGFWTQPIARDLFHATIDTTFALYRGGAQFDYGPSLRTAGRFIARHKPWYWDPESLTEEQKYYFRNANSSNSWRIADGSY